MEPFSHALHFLNGLLKFLGGLLIQVVLGLALVFILVLVLVIVLVLVFGLDLVACPVLFLGLVRVLGHMKEMRGLAEGFKRV